MPKIPKCLFEDTFSLCQNNFQSFSMKDKVSVQFPSVPAQSHRADVTFASAPTSTHNPMTGHRQWGSSSESHGHACIPLFPLCRIMFNDSEIMKHDTRLEQILQHLSKWIMKRGFDSSLAAAALTPAWCHLLSWKRSSFALGQVRRLKDLNMWRQVIIINSCWKFSCSTCHGKAISTGLFKNSFYTSSFPPVPDRGNNLLNDF